MAEEGCGWYGESKDRSCRAARAADGGNSMDNGTVRMFCGERRFAECCAFPFVAEGIIASAKTVSRGKHEK